MLQCWLEAIRRADRRERRRIRCLERRVARLERESRETFELVGDLCRLGKQHDDQLRKICDRLSAVETMYRFRIDAEASKN